MKLGEWRVQFSRKYRQYIDELSQLGVQVAQSTFDTVDPEEGNADITVSREFAGGVDFRIIASGEGVSFAEFGTGVLASTWGTSEVQADYAIAPGSWSEEHAQQFSKNGYWYYNGKRYYGTVPYAGMQQASADMRRESNGIVRRIFG